MKVVICGDSHLGAVYGLGGSNGKGGNTRIDDYEVTLNWIVDYCINNSVDVFVQTGDAFDSRNPNSEEISVMNRALKRLSMANITSVVIMGNHDYIRSGGGYTSSISSLAAKDYPNVRLVTEPQVLNVFARNGDSASIILMPFRDRRTYGGKSNTEDSALFDDEVKALIQQCTSPAILVGHNFFYEGTYNDYGQTEVLADWRKYEGLDMVAMGHYHQFKILNKKDPIAFYTGSMEKLNFGDQNIDKFIFEYDTSSKKVKPVKTPVNQIIDINEDFQDFGYEDIEDAIRKHLLSVDVANKIVRVRIKVRGNIASSLRPTFIKNLCYELGARYVSKVSFEAIHARLKRNAADLKDGQPIDIFEKFISNQEVLQSFRDKVLEEARQIIK